jgi:hypothetical protein
MKRSILRKFDMAELEGIHRTNPVAIHAFRKGNASGAHVKLQTKISRRQDREDERNWKNLIEEY